ncbi:MAG TPA: hypothetical protein VLX92_19360 [Kofleriaceae bacterium]|nr:hypothetical protein [Kofleriaceae bacterium]
MREDLCAPSVTSHPYRTPPTSPQPEPRVATGDDGMRLAMGVMAFTGAIQVGIGIVHPGTPSAATVFGASCFVAGLAWLSRHRERCSAGCGGSRSR